MKTVISAKETDKFLSDVLEVIPSNCLLQKSITGCGGTTLELTSKRNSIILVPTVNLVINKLAAFPDLIPLYGEIEKSQFQNKWIDSKRKGYVKIIATYDALPKLLNYTTEEIFNYFLLVDEYHILFNSYAYRYKAISFVLKNYHRFKNFCFMTATPLQGYSILTELINLPIVEIEWPSAIKVDVDFRNVYQTTTELNKLVREAEDNCWNLHIFINSIATIRTIIKETGITDYRTICSKNSKSKDMKLGGALNVCSINDPIKKYNFYTATAFEGVDIYDKLGKIIIISDTSISYSIIDISTLFRQICGRVRDSIYKNKVTFICNMTTHRYLKYNRRNDFYNEVNNKATLAKQLELDMLNSTETIKKFNWDTYNNNPNSFTDRYVNMLDEKNLVYDENLKNVDLQNYDLLNNVFNNSISVLDNLNKVENIQAKSKEVKTAIEILESLPTLELTQEEVETLIFPQLEYKTEKDFKRLFKGLYRKKRKRINGERPYVYDFSIYKTKL